jgi:hypothetical protein
MPGHGLSEKRREGIGRRELDDIHERMCQLGYISGRLLGPTEADETPMETLFQWTINLETQVLYNLWAWPQDFDIEQGLLLLMRLNNWRLDNWHYVGKQGWGGPEGIRRQAPHQDTTP